MARARVLSVFGTRPEAIKMAPVAHAVAAHPQLDSRVCVTAQHRGMLDQVLELFELTPDHDLEIMRPGQDLYDVTSRVLLGMRDVLKVEQPDVILVHGDTTTTFAATLAAFYARVPVAHVEAGLRTGNLQSPWPEEANRVLADALCAAWFPPTDASRDTLLREGADPDRVWTTGNTVIDALLWVTTAAPPPRCSKGTPRWCSSPATAARASARASATSAPRCATSPSPTPRRTSSTRSTSTRTSRVRCTRCSPGCPTCTCSDRSPTRPSCG